MNAETIRNLLTRQPFEAFELHLTNGEIHLVRHPEMAWVWGDRVFVGQHRGGRDPHDYSVKQLSVLHLTRVEEAPPVGNVYWLPLFKAQNGKRRQGVRLAGEPPAVLWMGRS